MSFLRTTPQRITAGVMFFVALLGIVLLSVPITRRYIANPTGQPAAIGATRVAVVDDSFQGHRYAPSVIQVPLGTTVTWEFLDRGTGGREEAVTHNVIGSGWGSPLMATGSWQYTFSTPGTYRYVCSLHPGMDGVVQVVTEAVTLNQENGS